MPYRSPIKSKSTNLLNGILGALYGTSGVEENPEYLSPGQEGPVAERGNIPFVGTGPFGGIKAREANAGIVAGRIAGQQGVQNSLALQRGLTPIELDRQTQLGNLQVQQQEAANNKALGEQGNTFFDYYSGLPTDQQNLVYPGGVGALPPSMVDIGKDIRARFGNNLNEGYARLPELGAKTGLETSVASDPRTLKGRVGQEYSKGIYALGGGSHLDIGGGQNQVFQGSSMIPHQTLEEYPTGKNTIDAEGNLVPVMGTKTITTQVEKPASAYNLQQPISDEEISAAKSVGGTRPVGPVASTRGYYDNNQNPGIGYEALPRFTVGQESDSGQSVNTPEAKAPPTSDLLSMYLNGIRGGLETIAEPIRDIGTGLGEMINPSDSISKPLPLPKNQSANYDQLNNRAWRGYKPEIPQGPRPSFPAKRIGAGDLKESERAIEREAQTSGFTYNKELGPTATSIQEEYLRSQSWPGMISGPGVTAGGLSEAQRQEVLNFIMSNPDADPGRILSVIDFVRKERR